MDGPLYVKTIETHARAFFKVIIFSIGSVIVLYLLKEWAKARYSLLSNTPS